MTTEEIEKAAQVESDKLVFYRSKDDFKRGFIKGFELSDKHWQEKTRWKSLEKEPPTIFGERVQVILKNKHGELSLAPVYSDRSIEDYLDFGFIEWKEIE